MRPHRFTHLFTSFLLSLALAACSGIPLRSLPRLIGMSGDILTTHPGDIMVALQVDARLGPPPNAVPLLLLKLTPKDPAAFAAVDKKLPLHVAQTGADQLGLPNAPAGRRWLIYSMPAATQTELQLIQATVRAVKADPSKNSGGSLAVGVEQSSLAVTDAALASTRWETWLQVKKADGFFEVWSGTLAQLRVAGGKDK